MDECSIKVMRHAPGSNSIMKRLAVEVSISVDNADVQMCLLIVMITDQRLAANLIHLHQLTY